MTKVKVGPSTGVDSKLVLSDILDRGLLGAVSRGGAILTIYVIISVFKIQAKALVETRLTVRVYENLKQRER